MKESGTGLLLNGSGHFESDGCLGLRLSSHPQAVVGVREGRLRVIHGQHQARAPHHQLVVSIRQLSVQII